MPDPLEKVSIIMPAYNGAKYIKSSIESCLGQTHDEIELIIVDDGSTDNTSEIIKSFHDPRLKYRQQPKNEGIVSALNKGFSLSTGSFLTWTSVDNLFLENAIEVMLEALERDPHLGFVYANYYMIDQKGKVLYPGKVLPPKELDADNYIGSCFLYRRKVYDEVGNFNQEAFLAEDYEYWLRVRSQFSMKKINHFLYHHRKHEDSLTSVNTEQKVQEQVEKIREQFISPAKRNYYRGKKCFYQNEHQEAKKYLIKSVCLNPFNYEAWRLIIMALFGNSLILKFRNLKHRLKN